jgi:hypothetical protein
MRNGIETRSALGVLLTALAVALLLAGVAQAQEVFDGAATISDDKDADADALLVNAGSTAFVDIQKTCVEGEDEVTIVGFSTHPDATSVDKGEAEVEQSEKGNQPDILVAGSGSMDFEVDLECDKSEVSGKADIDKSKGKFEIKAKKCEGLTTEQVIFVQDVCANAKNTKIKADGTQIKKLQVKGKGPATDDA